MTYAAATLCLWGAVYNLWIVLARRPVAPLRLTVDEFPKENSPLLSERASTISLVIFAVAWLAALASHDLVVA